MNKTARSQARAGSKALLVILNALTGLILALTALPGYPAQCEILPYANQCQGSNLWPVPAGWGADTNGDCQPEPLSRVLPVTFAYTYGAPNGGSCNDLKSSESEARYYCPLMAGDAAGACQNLCNWMVSPLTGGWTACTGSSVTTTGYQSNQWGLSMPYGTCTITGKINQLDGSRTGLWYTGRYCPANYTIEYSGPNQTGYCVITNPAGVQKPSDGICTQRRLPDGSLQSDPLDPDCAGVTQCTDAGKNLGQPCPQVGDTIR